jgi:hypothetical protein
MGRIILVDGYPSNPLDYQTRRIGEKNQLSSAAGQPKNDFLTS